MSIHYDKWALIYTMKYIFAWQIFASLAMKSDYFETELFNNLNILVLKSNETDNWKYMCPIILNVRFQFFFFPAFLPTLSIQTIYIFLTVIYT